MIKYIKDVLIYKSKGKIELYNKSEIEKIDELSQKTTQEELFYLINNLSKVEKEIKNSAQKTIMFQTEIIKLTLKESTSDIEDRIAKLELKIDSGDIKTSKIRYQENQTTEKIKEEKREKTTENTTKPKAQLYNIKSEEYWPKVITNLKNKGKVTLFTNLMNTKAVEINDMQLGIVGLTAFGKTVIEQPENKQEIARAILQESGKEMQIKVEEAQNVVNIKKNNTTFDIPINIIEE
jgi:DNA polymerase-3 subunit gamma/tau